MKYSGTYICGHKGIVNITGKASYREWKFEHVFSGLCPECYKKKLEEERCLKLEKAIKESNEFELPELSGTEKQIAWALTIRSEFINSVQDRIVSSPNEKVVLDRFKNISASFKEMSSSFENMIIKKTSAKFWIENRGDLYSKWFDYYLDNLNNHNDEIPEDVKKELEEQEAEVTVAPSELSKEGVVKISISEKTIYAEYVKDYDFIKIVKSKGYEWTGRRWKLPITQTTGSSVDRSADLGNALLANGFAIQFPDLKSKELGISGKFEPLCNNWIVLRKESNSLAIKWKGMNDTLYSKSRLLPGAKWVSSAMQVSVEFYREIIEFADTFEFRFTDEALSAIEKYKKKEEDFEIQHVEEAVPEEIDYDARLKRILEKEGVIEDLVDD